jgi:hypothetical protein
MSAPPSYVETTWSGLPLYVCLIDGHQNFDQVIFAEHMQVTHQEVMSMLARVSSPEAVTPAAVTQTPASDEPVPAVEASDPDAPADGPPQGEADADPSV